MGTTGPNLVKRVLALLPAFDPGLAVRFQKSGGNANEPEYNKSPEIFQCLVVLVIVGGQVPGHGP